MALRAAEHQAGVKCNAKRAADHWRSTAGPKLFIMRGGFNGSDEMSIDRLQVVLREVTHVTEHAAIQLQ